MSRTFRTIPWFNKPRHGGYEHLPKKMRANLRRDRNVNGFDGMPTYNVEAPNTSAPKGYGNGIVLACGPARVWAKRKAHHIARRRGKKGIAQDLVQFYLDAHDDDVEMAAFNDYYSEFEKWDDSGDLDLAHDDYDRWDESHYDGYDTGYDDYEDSDRHYEEHLEYMLRMHALNKEFNL